jgi:hypothetical protein
MGLLDHTGERMEPAGWAEPGLNWVSARSA